VGYLWAIPIKIFLARRFPHDSCAGSVIPKPCLLHYPIDTILGRLVERHFSVLPPTHCNHRGVSVQIKYLHFKGTARRIFLDLTKRPNSWRKSGNWHQEHLANN